MSIFKSKHRQSNNAFPVFNEGLEPVASPGLETFASAGFARAAAGNPGHEILMLLQTLGDLSEGKLLPEQVNKQGARK